MESGIALLGNTDFILGVNMTLTELYQEKVKCNACRLRTGCTQVVPGDGCMESPILMLVGECGGQEEDEIGVPFVGRCGQLLREVLRATKIINRTNTLISNTVGCRPPKNKFPTDDCPNICVSKWLWKEIELAAPKRMLLLGNTPLKYVAGLTGITTNRGRWFNIRGIRTLATYHPSYILRTDQAGMLQHRETFEADIKDVANEVKTLLEGSK